MYFPKLIFKIRVRFSDITRTYIFKNVKFYDLSGLIWV